MMHRLTFAELYCEKHNLSIERYAQSVLRETLYLHARPVAWLINLVNHEYFAPDRDFVEDVGRLRTYHDFIGSGLDFSHHPANSGFLRSVLRVRISTEKMRRLVKDVLKHKHVGHHVEEVGTIEPFAKDGASESGEAKEPGN